MHKTIENVYNDHFKKYVKTDTVQIERKRQLTLQRIFLLLCDFSLQVTSTVTVKEISSEHD